MAQKIKLEQANLNIYLNYRQRTALTVLGMNTRMPSKKIWLAGILLFLSACVLTCLGLQSAQVTPSVKQLRRAASSATGIGRVQRKSKPVIPDSPPGDLATLPSRQIAVHRRLAESTGLYSIYCPWPGGGAPEYTMVNNTNGRQVATAQRNLFIQGGWLFGFVDTPSGEMIVQPQRYVSTGLGGGGAVQFYRILWSPGEDDRSVQCTVEQPVEVELVLEYEGSGRASVTVSGCGLRSEAVLGVKDSVTLQSSDEPNPWYAVSGPCELTGTYTIYPTEPGPMLAKGALEPIPLALQPNMYHSVVIGVPHPDEPMSLDAQIEWSEIELEEYESHLDWVKQSPAVHRKRFEETEALLETLCDASDLHPEVRQQLEYQLSYTSGRIDSLDNWGDFDEMNEVGRKNLVEHLEKLRAQRDNEEP
jgi:hypothetical protein